ncbi:MAG: FAD-dependent oxidoreductase [Ignavibacteriaceae bacterium]
MNYKELHAADIDELKNGDMKIVKTDDEKEILLCRIDDEFYATGPNCPHYGAPLSEGILSGDRIVCPWHHSCFNAKTGDLLEPPALDALTTFEVKTKKNKVIIMVPDELKGTRTPPMVKQDKLSDKRNFVIIGAGAAGYSAAQTLRETGFKGNIMMITYEDKTPYDRPNLSKAYLSGEAPEEWMPLRSEEFYQAYGIELKHGKRVVSLDIENKKLSFVNGDRLAFDKLLIAVGGVPRTLDIPGSELRNIFYLRSFINSDQIVEAAHHAKNLVIIGSSFIGMETAISLKERYNKLNITVVSPDDIPFKKIFGDEIGSLFLQIHRKHGINFKLNTTAISFKGKDTIEAAILKNGDVIESDMAVIGIGVKPATEFLGNIVSEKDGSIKTDKNFSAYEDIYAAGDIVTYPDWRTGNYMRIEHWRTAQQQGRRAAYIMAGIDKPDDSIPFFWTKQADLELKYVGHASGWDEIKIDGQVQSKDFIAYYIKDNNILAAAGTRDKEMAEIHEKMRKGLSDVKEYIK